MKRFVPYVVCLACSLLSLPSAASLIAGFATHDGVVISADSRLGRVTPSGTHQIVSDEQTKLLILQSRILVGLAGKSDLGGKSVWRTVQEIGEKMPSNKNLTDFMETIAGELTKIHKREIKNPTDDDIVIMLIAGYQDGVGQLAEVKVPDNTVEVLKTTENPGLAWIGDVAIPARLILGVDTRVSEDKRWDDDERKALKQKEFLFADNIPLADAVEVVRLAIQTSIDWSKYFKGTLDEPAEYHSTIGGAIDIAVVTPTHASWIQRKESYTTPPGE
ncbi:MAG TPA: hypothetical protein PLO37_00410 [Candidatus Hydrogenedentes bacterium]|nr:hypothetical protein [Candidatus Hydrogenedentota bacterium]HPG65275.1 hypothetical protein [Candidatus Hydrogenedentota bacterium]